MEQLNDLDLADDVVLLVQREVHMQSKLDDLSESSKAAGLKFNVAKTKSMKANANSSSSFTVAGQQIEKVETFQYLVNLRRMVVPTQVQPHGSGKLEVPLQVSAAFGASAESLCKRNSEYIIQASNWSCCTDVKRGVSLRRQRKNCRCSLIVACVTPYALGGQKIGSPTRTFTVSVTNRLIETEIRDRKWKWIGHTLRKGANEISKEALDWNPQGQRRRGRPRGSWRRSLVAGC